MEERSPTFCSFSVAELAFFWNPRRWRPDIVERFAAKRPGSMDIRDAIIEVDDEGGAGFLHWHKDLASWALTAKGKSWVVRLGSPAVTARERDWVAKGKPQKIKASELGESVAGDVLPTGSGSTPDGAAEASQEDELAKLIAEQSEDVD